MFTTTAANIAAQRQASLFEEPAGELSLTDYAAQSPTFDAMAARIMLTEQDPARRDRLLSAGAQMASEAHGLQCPECSCRDVEDNGEAGRWAEFRCQRCDHRWGPGTEA